MQRRGVFHARRTDAVLLLVAIVWGSSYLAAKTATYALPVLMVLFARYAISAIACLALVAARSRKGRYTRDEVRVGALLGITQAAVLVLETYGVAHTSAANAGLIISLTIVLTPLLDRTAGNGRLPPRFFAATGVCLLAVALLMSGSGFHAPRIGDLLMLAAAVVRAAHVALVGRLTKGRVVRPLQLTAVQTVVGSALFVVPAASGLPTLTRSMPGLGAARSISPCSAACSPSSPRPGRCRTAPPAGPVCCWAPNRSGPSRSASASAAKSSPPLPASGRRSWSPERTGGRTIERAHRTTSKEEPHAGQQHLPSV